ncbi:MAG: hypothetical protein M3290_08530, partial [Actinomycetota bacterium]|nr:hypothetical protein [Actinomycetota bacterium]
MMHTAAAGLTGTRVIEFGLLGAFMVWQVVRLSDALHIFQLEGYKRARFVSWCRGNVKAALFLSAPPAKKPLVMTSRARRVLISSSLVCLVVVVVLDALIDSSGAVELAAEVGALVVLFVATPLVVVAADVLLAPIQSSINATYLRRARSTLARVDPV